MGCLVSPSLAKTGEDLHVSEFFLCFYHLFAVYICRLIITDSCNIQVYTVSQ